GPAAARRRPGRDSDLGPHGRRRPRAARRGRDTALARARARALRVALGPWRPALALEARGPGGRGVLPRRRGHGDGARPAQGRGPAPQAASRLGRGAAVLTVLNVPNFLTLLRIVAIPCFLILLEDLRYREALAVFVAAGVTDGLDGAIARLTHTKTTLGAFLDPAADKALLVSAFIALGFMHAVPRWLVVIVISRDVLIVLGYFLLFMLARQTMEVRPSVAGKTARRSSCSRSRSCWSPSSSRTWSPPRPGIPSST